ncbi:MAG: hypothetical protein ACP5RS_07165 [Thermoplasmata archaeon]
MLKDLLWVRIDGIEKDILLKYMGFDITEAGVLMLNGKPVKTIDGNDQVKVEYVKAVLPGSLSVITDISEVEQYSDDD